MQDSINDNETDDATVLKLSGLLMIGLKDDGEYIAVIRLGDADKTIEATGKTAEEATALSVKIALNCLI